MNNLPYRAWHIERKQMYPVEGINWVHEEVILDTDVYHDKLFRFEDIVLMQSTGIQDKNGVMIFEGDILLMRPKGSKRDEDGPYALTDKFKALVKRHPAYNHLSYWVIPGGYETSLKKKVEIEIIGSIHTHPHLLQGE